MVCSARRTCASSHVLRSSGVSTSSGGTLTRPPSSEIATKVRKALLVNCRVPLQWEHSVNDALAYAARHWKNVVLVDWWSITDGRPQLLVDGAHMKPEGARMYARAIAKAIRAPAGTS